MSFFSSILGGIVGVALAALIPGPLGWKLGLFAFTIGMGVGSYIDPVTPDIDSAGQPQIGELRITTALEGAMIPEMLGTSKLTGNIFYYWGERSEEVTKQVETGGKGSGGATQTVTEGWKYYLSWCQGFCMGPIDVLYAVYAGDDLVWEGELERPVDGGPETLSLGSLSASYETKERTRAITQVPIVSVAGDYLSFVVSGNPWEFADNNDDITPVDSLTYITFRIPEGTDPFGSEYLISPQTITSRSYDSELDQTTIYFTAPYGFPPAAATTRCTINIRYSQQFAIAETDTPMGSARFYFGTDTQLAQAAYAGAISNSNYASAFRGLCYIVFRDCYIGPNRTAPSISIVAKRNPVYGFSADETLNTYDYNPAHAIYHIIEGEDRLLGLTGYCDETTFASAASTLATEERGIGLVMDRVASGKDWVETILKHVRGMLRSSSDE